MGFFTITAYKCALEGTALVKLEAALMTVEGRTNHSRCGVSRVEIGSRPITGSSDSSCAAMCIRRTKSTIACRKPSCASGGKSNRGRSRTMPGAICLPLRSILPRDRHRPAIRYAAPVAHDSLSDELIDDAGPDAEATAHWRHGMRQLEQPWPDCVTRPVRSFCCTTSNGSHIPKSPGARGVTTRTVEREMARALTHCAERLQPFLEGS